MSLFEQLVTESQIIGNKQAVLSQIEEEARVSEDIETLKVCIRKQREYTNRLMEIGGMLEQIVEEESHEHGQ